MVNLPLICPKKAKGRIYLLQWVKHNFSPNAGHMHLSTHFSSGKLVPFPLRGAGTLSRQEDPGELMEMQFWIPWWCCHCLGNVQDDLDNTEQDFTLFSSIILHPDSFLWPSQTPPKSEMAAFRKAACSNFLEVPQAFGLSPLHGCTWGPLCSCKGSVLHVWNAPQGQEYIYSKCKDKYLPELICDSTTGKLFKNNNNNNHKETSQEIKEWLIPLAGLIYFYTSNNKETGNELHLLSSIQ